MIFRDYYFLFLVPFLLVLLPFILRISKFKASVKFSSAAIPGLTAKSELLPKIFFWSRIVALILIATALARPQKTGKTEIPPAEGIDIMLCLDTSYSMAAMDFEPNRLEAAKSAAKMFVNDRKNDRIGLVAFGASAILTCPLTHDHSALSEFIETTSLNMIDAKGTAVGDAVMTSINHIEGSKAKSKIIILLTDGRSNAGIISEPADAAKIAKTFDIKIYAIGTAKKGVSKIPTGDPFTPVMQLKDDLDEATLMEIASLTGGKFFRAENTAELKKIYSEIDSMEKTKFNVNLHVSHRDKYEPFLWAALILVILLFIFENILYPRVP